MAHDITKDVIGCKEFEVQKLNQSGEPLEIHGDIKLPLFTDGSIPFINSDLKLAQNNLNLSWNVGRTQLEPNLIKITSDGSQAYPALKFNDTNTGFYKSGDSIRTSINNSTKMTVDATGVGIGTATPSEKLHVKQTSGGDVAIELENTEAVSTSDAIVKINTATSGGDPLIQYGILARKNYSMGVDSTDLLFKISNSTSLPVNTVFTIDSNTGSVVSVKDSATAQMRIQTDASGDSSLVFSESVGTDHIKMEYDGGDNKMYITSNSAGNIMTWDRINTNIGINTTNPGAQLEIQGGAIGNKKPGILRLNNGHNSQVAEDENGIVEFWNSDASGPGIAARIVSRSAGAERRELELGFETGIGANATEKMRISGLSGNVGIGTIIPSQPLSVKEKVGMTAIGGIAIKLTNKTGSNTVAGQLVKPYSATAIDDAFVTIVASDQEIIGIVLEAGVSDGSEAWVVVNGIADVLMDAGGSARGDRIISSTTAGSGLVWNVGGAVATHFQEIGHCIETRTGAGLARCVLHFN